MRMKMRNDKLKMMMEKIKIKKMLIVNVFDVSDFDLDFEEELFSLSIT
jgi:hypothetical protein